MMETRRSAEMESEQLEEHVQGADKKNNIKTKD